MCGFTGDFKLQIKRLYLWRHCDLWVLSPLLQRTLTLFTSCTGDFNNPSGSKIPSVNHHTPPLSELFWKWTLCLQFEGLFSLSGSLNSSIVIFCLILSLSRAAWQKMTHQSRFDPLWKNGTVAMLSQFGFISKMTCYRLHHWYNLQKSVSDSLILFLAFLDIIKVHI